MNARRRRLLGAAKWLGLLVSVALLLGWMESHLIYPGWFGDTVGMQLESGKFVVYRQPGPTALARPAQPAGFCPSVGSAISSTATWNKNFEIPIWPFLLPVAAVTVFLWCWHERRRPWWHCRECGYNLSGGIRRTKCPECGTCCVP